MKGKVHHMKLIQKWNKISLVIRILIGLVIGAGLGFLFPQASWIGVLGDLFVGALRAVAPILVAVLVISSLANAKGGDVRKFRTVIFLYLFSTLCAAIVAVFMSFLFKVQLPLSGVDGTGAEAPENLREVVLNVMSNIVENPVGALFNGNYIGILFWAVILGIALKKSRPETKILLVDLAEAMSTVVKWVISLAPFGILGLAYSSISENGMEIFRKYGQMVLLIVLTMLVVALVVNPLIVGLTLRHNPYPLIFYCIRNSGLTAFFTRSSAANIPVNLELCRKLGLDEDLYSVSIPLGATINMDGAAVTITVFSLAAAFTTGVSVTIPMAILLSIIATFAACGASGVAGGSLLLVPLGCSLFGINATVAMQVVGIGFIIGVIQDSLETALNSSGDAIFTATAEFREWKKQGKELPL